MMMLLPQIKSVSHRVPIVRILRVPAFVRSLRAVSPSLGSSLLTRVLRKRKESEKNCLYQSTPNRPIPRNSRSGRSRRRGGIWWDDRHPCGSPTQFGHKQSVRGTSQHGSSPPTIILLRPCISPLSISISTDRHDGFHDLCLWLISQR